MKKHFSLLTVLACFILFAQSVSAQSIYKNYKDGQLYLKLKNDVSLVLPDYNGKNTKGYPKELKAVMKKYGVTSLKKAFRTIKTIELQHTYIVQFSQFSNINELIKALEVIGIVDYAEKVPYYKASLTPNDTYYNNEFAMPLIGAPAAWALSTGNHSVKVAVVDNAVMVNHTDLAANKWVNAGEIAGNGIDDDNNGYVDDINGYDVADNDNNPAPPVATASATVFEHGTHCGGIADAVSNNGAGVASIGYNLSLIGVKCEPDNTSNPDQISYAMYGVEYAMAAHANVISMSWGGGGFSQTEQNIFTQAWNQGIILVAAAGNDGVSTVEYPAGYLHVLAVGSTTNADVVSSFSNYGTWVGVMAPGSNIYSTLPGTNGASTYGYLSGTSMATPMVAGLCGLMKAYSPSSTNTQIIACLKSSCTNINAQNPSYVGQMGSGRINALAALQCLTAPPVANFKGDATQTCSGILHFTDLSTGSPASWAWNFGDGGTSTQQNPVHEYFTNGTFTVTLTATNSQGTNTATKTNYVVVGKPGAPAATGGSRCGTGSVSLSSSSANIVRWYNTATSPDPVATSGSFATPSITGSTTYYVEDSILGAVSSVGPATYTTLGTAGYFSNSTDRYLMFNCLSPCILKSVLVYAQTAGTRVIELRDSAGNVLQTISPSLAAGANTVTLNFNLPVGNNLQLGINGTANLYRNSAVASGYPFTLAGLVSITGTNAGAGFYYYFYNWQIQTPGCVSLRAPVVATVTPGFFAGITGTDVSCFGNNNGSLTANTLGGGSQLNYAWSSGQNTNIISSLAPGTYTVSISDANGCSATATHTVTQPTALAASVSKTNVTCYAGSNGAINLTVSGGTSSYSYNWGGNVTTQNRTGLSAGTYTVTITDAQSCTTIASATIAQPATALTETITPVNGGCGTTGGSASVTTTGGTNNYSYVWSNSLTGSSISNLSSGNYSVTVTDGNSCTASASTTITNTGALNITPSTTAASCFGAATGAASLSLTGATNPVTYSWSNGSSSSSITNVAAGTYTVTVVDGAGCSATLSQTVSQPSALITTISTTPAACSQSNGGASTNVTGGTSGYTYSWSNGLTTASLSATAAGNYTVTVTDSHGCTVTATGIVNNSGSLSASAIKTNVTCNGGSNGSILLNVSGATNPVTYAWSNGATDAYLTGIASGSYTVTVTDGSGCSAIVAQTLTQPLVVSVTTTTGQPTCNGLSNGSATVTGDGGTAPYLYIWSNATGNSSISNVAAGSYTVTVTDANSCSSVATVVLTDPSPVSASVASASPVCNGDASGTAQITVTGGSGLYTYVWSNGNTSSNVTGLAAGNYSVTITDSHNCSITSTAAITQPNPVQVTTSATTATAGQSNGTATVTNANNATAPYTYLWSNGETTATASNLAAGTYTVTLIDANGCHGTATAIISEVTGINDLAAGVSFSLYPNPASTKLFINFNQLNASTIINIKNVLGQTLLTKPVTELKETIDVSLFAGGVYFIEVTQAGKKTVQQFVVAK